jgi:hypothetical protein
MLPNEEGSQSVKHVKVSSSQHWSSKSSLSRNFVDAPAKYKNYENSLTLVIVLLKVGDRPFLSHIHNATSPHFHFRYRSMDFGCNIGS